MWPTLAGGECDVKGGTPAATDSLRERSAETCR